MKITLLLNSIKQTVLKKYRKLFNTDKLIKFHNWKLLKWFILLITFVFLLFILTPISMIYFKNYDVGDIPTEDIKSHTKLRVVDLEKTNAKKKNVLINIPPVYMLNEDIIIHLKTRLQKVFLEYIKIMENKSVSKKEKINKLKEKLHIDKKNAQNLVNSNNFDYNDNNLIVMLDELNDLYVFNKRIKSNQTKIIISTNKGDIVISKEKIITSQKLKKQFSEFLISNYNKYIAKFIIDIINKEKLVQDFIKYDKIKSNKLKTKYLEEIQPVYKNIKVNQIIVEEGKPITKQTLETLKTLKIKSIYSNYIILLGRGLIILFSLIVFVLYIYRYKPKIFDNDLHLLLICLILVLTTILIRGGIVDLKFSPYLIPIAAGGIIIAILLDSRIGIMMSIILCIFTALVTEGKWEYFIANFFANVIGIFSVYHVRQRKHLMRAGIFISLSYIATIFAFSLFSRNTISLTANTQNLLYGTLNGFLSSGIALASIPYLEVVFKITTDISLLELSDINHPLLRRMIIDAPGTYNHSILVSTIAESTAEEIGANSLLCRVGAFFHDVGKLAKPPYFIENAKNLKVSKHSGLTPSMSSLILASHVKEGINIAKRYKLPEKILEIINEHHGTSLISFFYQQAMKNDTHKVLSKDNYRYPGPKPQSKEAAIIMLADSVEAASRSLDDINISRIKLLVNNIIQTKLEDGQLDECDLTSKEIYTMKEVFVRLLSGIFHTRVKYENNN